MMLWQMPYGQMPVLHVKADDGSVRRLAQARAILRYLGRILRYQKKPLYPEDAYEAFLCDEVIELTEELRSKHLPLFKMKVRHDTFRSHADHT